MKLIIAMAIAFMALIVPPAEAGGTDNLKKALYSAISSGNQKSITAAFEKYEDEGSDMYSMLLFNEGREALHNGLRKGQSVVLTGRIVSVLKGGYLMDCGGIGYMAFLEANTGSGSMAQGATFVIAASNTGKLFHYNNALGQRMTARTLKLRAVFR